MVRWAINPYQKPNKKKKAQKCATKKAPKKKAGPKKSKAPTCPIPAQHPPARSSAAPAPAVPRRAQATRRRSESVSPDPGRRSVAPSQAAACNAARSGPLARRSGPARPASPSPSAPARGASGSAAPSRGGFRLPSNASPVGRRSATAAQQATVAQSPAAPRCGPSSASTSGRGRGAAPTQPSSTVTPRASSRGPSNASPARTRASASAASRPAPAQPVIPPSTTLRARPSACPAARKRGRAASPVPCASVPRSSGSAAAAPSASAPNATPNTVPPKKRGRPLGCTKEFLRKRNSIGTPALGTRSRPSTSTAAPGSASTSRPPPVVRGNAASARGRSSPARVPATRRSGSAARSPTPPAPQPVPQAPHGRRPSNSGGRRMRTSTSPPNTSRTRRAYPQATPTPPPSPLPDQPTTPPACDPVSSSASRPIAVLSQATASTQTSPQTPPPHAEFSPISPSLSLIWDRTPTPSPTLSPQRHQQLLPANPALTDPRRSTGSSQGPPNNSHAVAQLSPQYSWNAPSTSGPQPPRARQRIPVIPNPRAPNRVRRALTLAGAGEPTTPTTPVSTHSNDYEFPDSPVYIPSPVASPQSPDRPAGSSQGARRHIEQKLADRLSSPPPAKRYRPSDPVQNGLPGPKNSEPSTSAPAPPQRYNSGFSKRRAIAPSPQSAGLHTPQAFSRVLTTTLEKMVGSSINLVIDVSDDDEVQVEREVLVPRRQYPRLYVPGGAVLDWRRWSAAEVVEWARMWGAAEATIQEMRRTRMDGMLMDQLFKTNNGLDTGRTFQFSNTEVAKMWRNIQPVFDALVRRADKRKKRALTGG